MARRQRKGKGQTKSWKLGWRSIFTVLRSMIDFEWRPPRSIATAQVAFGSSCSVRSHLFRCRGTGLLRLMRSTLNFISPISLARFYLIFLFLLSAFFYCLIHSPILSHFLPTNQTTFTYQPVVFFLCFVLLLLDMCAYVCCDKRCCHRFFFAFLTFFF